MKVLNFPRTLVLAFLFAALLAGVFVLDRSVADAQGPTSGVHFMGVTHGSSRITKTSPLGSTSNLVFYGGPVMLTTTSYTIFWEPSGHSTSSTYKTLINRFFADVGGSGLYNVMTQYHDNAAQP